MKLTWSSATLICMRSLLVVVGLCTLTQAQTFKSTLDQVAVSVTIQSDPAERAADLRPEDFRVFDNGRQVPIVTFGKMRQSVHVLLLLDTSRSMAESLLDVKTAATAIIARLAPGDSVQIGTFSNLLRLSPAFSADESDLVGRLSFVPGANMTILYDALVEGCSTFTGEMDRRAIFVVSDGMDTASNGSARDVMQKAAEASVAIYSVGLTSRYVERGKSIVLAPNPVLHEIADDTGGQYVYAGSGRDYSRLFEAMIEELHQQYILGFTPTQADGKLHSLRVTTRRPNVNVRSRKQYLAPVS